MNQLCYYIRNAVVFSLDVMIRTFAMTVVTIASIGPIIRPVQVNNAIIPMIPSFRGDLLYH